MNRSPFKESATEAARAYGWTVPTYLGHENGDRIPGRPNAKKYASKYRIRWEWLLENEGGPTHRNHVELGGRIGAGAQIHTDIEQLGELHEVEVQFPVPPNAIAFEVEGDSMVPRYDEGDLVICSKDSVEIEMVLGSEAAVKTEDGRRFLKRVIPSSGKHLYNLESHNANPIRDVHLEWVGKILAVLPKDQWKTVTESKPKTRNFQERRAETRTGRG
jgi:phage repressor protein C with HTH and peptisase S24 domain